MCYTGYVKLDGRALDHGTLEQIRKRTVLQIAEGEHSIKDVAGVLGFNVRTIQKWAKKYREGGVSKLDAIPLTGRPSKLTDLQKKRIAKLVIGKDPRQLKLPFALWTREQVKELILRLYGLELSLTSVGRLLHEMGLSVQKPKYQAWQQNEDEVRAWKEIEYPAIVKQAKKIGADIYFQDEAGIRSDYHSGTTWAKKGETPVIKTTGARFGLNMISAISPRGHLRFMCTEGKVNASVFVEFLKRLMYKADRPIFLVVDGHPIHKSKIAKQYIESTNGNLTLFFLPPYSPQLNPDESVWREVKTHHIGRTPVTGPKHLHSLAMSALRSLQRSPKKLQGLFKTPELSYIPVG